MNKRQLLLRLLEENPGIEDELLSQALELSGKTLLNTKKCYEMAEAAGVGLETFMQETKVLVHGSVEHRAQHPVLAAQ